MEQKIEYHKSSNIQPLNVPEPNLIPIFKALKIYHKVGDPDSALCT